jgi:hypothetical protein
MSDPHGTIGIYRKGGGMRTIEELVNEIYEDNYSHIEFDENMGGEECDCHIHTTLNTIVKYWWDEK